MGRGKRWDADMRKAIISMCLHGLQIDQVARLTGASQRTISRVMLERRQNGDQVAEARRAPPPEHDARRLDFWARIEQLRLEQGCTQAEAEANLSPDDVRAVRIVDMCVFFANALTVGAEHGRFVARAGPDSIFAAFSALFPDLCVLEEAERKACAGMDKVTISFFNRALEYSGGFERQRRKKWRPGEAGREAGTWMFGCRRWIDFTSWQEMAHFQRWFRAFCDRLPAHVGVPSEFHIMHVVHRISISWLSKTPDIPGMPPPSANSRISKSKTSRHWGASVHGMGGTLAGSDAVWATGRPPPPVWMTQHVWTAELLPPEATPRVLAAHPRHAQSFLRDQMCETPAQVSAGASHMNLVPSGAVPQPCQRPAQRGVVVHDDEESASGEEGNAGRPQKSTTRGRRFTPQLRRAVVNMCNHGCSHGEVATYCNVSVRTVSRILGELRKYGEDTAYEKRQRRQKMVCPGAHVELLPAHQTLHLQLDSDSVETGAERSDESALFESVHARESEQERGLFAHVHDAPGPVELAAPLPPSSSSPAPSADLDVLAEVMCFRGDGECESECELECEREEFAGPGFPVLQSHVEAFATDAGWALKDTGAIGTFTLFPAHHNPFAL